MILQIEIDDGFIPLLDEAIANSDMTREGFIALTIIQSLSLAATYADALTEFTDTMKQTEIGMRIWERHKRG